MVASLQSYPNDPLKNVKGTVTLAERAAQLAGGGAFEDAAQLYRRVLEHDPNDSNALQFLGWQALKNGRLDEAVALLARARDAGPQHPALHVTLGQAHMAGGDFAAAIESFDSALLLSPGLAPALLYKGLALERMGEPVLAAAAFHGALFSAQRTGEWADIAALPFEVRQLIKHAADSIRRYRRQILLESLAHVRKRYGSSALRRIERCIGIYIYEIAPDYPDPRQHPNFLFIPGLPSRPFFEDHADFPWLAELEASTGDVREELLLQSMREPVAFHPVVSERGHSIPDSWRDLNGSMKWNGLYFYRHGKRLDENCRRCPRTAGLLDALPLMREPGHSPEAHFSVLQPGAHIPVHTGVTNARVVVHLPLIIPQNCGIRIAAETRTWTEGKCLVFDDTFEHEAWNGSTETRTILILDTWNPYLTPAEREGISAVIQTISQTPLLQN